jgi:zinc finger protein
MDQNTSLSGQSIDNHSEEGKYELHCPCPVCGKECITRVQLLNIPHFKETLVMGTYCDDCGHKSSDIKSVGEGSEQARKITLKLERIEDLYRELVKSETCSLYIPELGLELTMGSMGGRFTTVEGILILLMEEVRENIYATLDSDDSKVLMQSMAETLKLVSEAKIPVTLILDDPLANSYIQNLSNPDPQITIEDYDRTDEQNENLGFKDIQS